MGQMCAYWVGCVLRGAARPVGSLGCIAGLLGRTREWRKGEGKWSGWPGRAQLPAEFRPTAKLELEFPFLFSNLFTISN
jgi:hypothetical protein